MHTMFTTLFILSATLPVYSFYTLKERTPSLNPLKEENPVWKLAPPRKTQIRKDSQNGTPQKQWLRPNHRELDSQSLKRTENENENPFQDKRAHPFQESLFGGKKQQKEVDSFIEAVMRCKHVPGLSVAVVKAGERWTEGYGVGEMKRGVPVGRDTMFGVGSVTKAFTSALLAIAVEEVNSEGNDITWQTRVKELVSEDLELAKHLQDNMTLEDILAHRTGLMAADIMAVAGFPPHVSRAQFIRELRYLPDFLPFRLSWYYNNWIYSLAGDVTEYLLGDKWEKLLKERLLMPLGMKDSLLVWDDINVTSSKMARPYQRIRGSLKELDKSLFDLRQGRPSGSLAASADDMAKWMKFLLQQGVVQPSGDRLLSQRMMEDMMTSHITINVSLKDVPVGDRLDGYGFGWFKGSYRGKPTVSHTGGWFGYQCTLTLFPEDQTAVYVAINGPGTSAGNDAFRTISYFLSDLALGYSPWLNQSTACAFGDKPGNKTKGDHADGNTTTIQNPGRYIGKYSHPLFGEVEIKNSTSHYGLTLQFQRLEGFLIPRESDMQFYVQYTGATMFYSVENFEVKTSRLSFGRPTESSGGTCVSLILRAPGSENVERLEFTREK
ncbi:hypothetical protein ACOMHN_005183 [Nucella lapillus]